MPVTSNTVGEIRDLRGTVSVEWKIPDFFSLTHKADTYYESPPFLLSRSSWFIRIYPNGQRQNESVEWFGMYLRRMDGIMDGNLYVTATLGIKNHDGTVYNSYTLRYTFDDCSLSWGWNKFEDRHNLRRQKYKIAPDGILTIFCVASVSTAVEVATQTSPVDSTDGLCNDFRSLFLSGQESDVVFKVNGTELRAHKLILQARSPVLDAMFQRDWRERNSGVVTITDFDSKTFHEFLLFLYTGKIENLASDNVAGLYSIADKYQVKELRERCVRFMKDNLTIETVCDILAVADRHQEEELRKSAKELLVRNIKQIIPTEKWKSFYIENSVLAVELLMSVIPTDTS